jgi:hypothetical protein
MILFNNPTALSLSKFMRFSLFIAKIQVGAAFTIARPAAGRAVFRLFIVSLN